MTAAPRRWVPTTIRARLMLTIVAVAVVPLLVLLAVLAPWANRNLERQSLELQQLVAARVETEIHATMEGAARRLEMLDKVAGIGTATTERQRELISSLVAADELFEEIAIVGVEGRETMRVSRTNVVLDAALTDRSGEGFLDEVLTDDEPYFGPVVFEPGIREPLVTLGSRVLDRRTDTVEMILVAKVRFKPIWDLLSQITVPEQGDVYVVTGTGAVVAHRRPDVVLGNASIELPAEDGFSPGLTDRQAVVATADLALGNQRLVVVAEQASSQVFEISRSGTWITLIAAAAALVLALGLDFIATRSIVRPIESLADSARRISSGDYSHRAEVVRDDEVGDLARTFNSMTVKLGEAITELETRVAQRTADLEDAVTVQRQLIEDSEARNAELEDVKEQLELLVTSKDQFLGSVSHELRTPLTSVVGFAEELHERYEHFSDDERRALLHTIAQESQEMAQIINDLLVAARRDPSQLVIDVTPIDLAGQIENVLATMPTTRVTTHATEPDAFAIADEVRTRQILRNLVGNSVRYGGDDIEIRIDSTDDEVVVQVRDDGDGIPESDWELVFDPYRTAHRNGTQTASVGLGLTVSRMLARRMDGDLTYRMEEGHSVFELTLPRATPEKLGSGPAGTSSS